MNRPGARAPRPGARPWGGENRHPAADGQPRLFVAVPLSAGACEAVAEVAERVRTAHDGVRARWVRFDGLHLTLQFLGPTPESAVPSLAAALTEVAARSRPFTVRLSGAGAFPNIQRPRTLWVDVVAGAEELTNLSASLAADERVAEWLPQRPGNGGPLERKPYTPHLTIARTDGVPGAARLARSLATEAADLDVAFMAERLVLYRSHLGRGPARYEPLSEARLGG